LIGLEENVDMTWLTTDEQAKNGTLSHFRPKVKINQVVKICRCLDLVNENNKQQMLILT
jgi:hypothetical protein